MRPDVVVVMPPALDHDAGLGHLSTADDAKEKQLVGDLWAEGSDGRCLFTMIQNREFQRIDRLIGAITVPSLRL